MEGLSKLQHTGRKQSRQSENNSRLCLWEYLQVLKITRLHLLFPSAATCSVLRVELNKTATLVPMFGTGEALRFPEAHALLNSDSSCETMGNSITVQHSRLPQQAHNSMWGMLWGSNERLMMDILNVTDLSYRSPQGLIYEKKTTLTKQNSLVLLLASWSSVVHLRVAKDLWLPNHRALHSTTSNSLNTFVQCFMCHRFFFHCQLKNTIK